jgi:hypothetical protein
MSRLKDSYAGCMECGGSMKMKKGGWIQKAIKNPGSFTKQAQSAGMSVSAFRNKVLANKGDYSSTTVKRANLAKTLSKMRKGDDGMEVTDEVNIVSPRSAQWESLSEKMPAVPSTKLSTKPLGLVKGGTEKVAAYQRMLKAKGFNVDVDGAWGKNTQAAYEKYMRSTKQSTPSKMGPENYNPNFGKVSNNLPSINLPSSSGIKSPEVKRKMEIQRPLNSNELPSINLPTSTGIKRRMMMGGSIPGVNGSVIGSSVPMSKTGQSFPKRNAGTSKLAKYKKK